MDRQDVCILLNSTPKYFYLLPLQLTMLRRYAPSMKWPIYFATEEYDKPFCKQLATQFGIHLLPLEKEKAGFFESRAAALQQLPSEILYVLPLQEDFLLDRQPMTSALHDALFILDTDRHISSIRLMPCPGPLTNDPLYVTEKPWRILTEKNLYIFTYQATLWRRMDLKAYFEKLLHEVKIRFTNPTEIDKKHIALTSNLAENPMGQRLLRNTLPDTLHLSWPREGQWSNAVYLCPWPYRPTAVTRGRLEPFAEELFQREGVKFERPQGNMLE